MTNTSQQVGVSMLDMLTVPDLENPNERGKLMMKDILEQVDMRLN